MVGDGNILFTYYGNSLGETGSGEENLRIVIPYQVIIFKKIFSLIVLPTF